MARTRYSRRSRLPGNVPGISGSPSQAALPPLLRIVAANIVGTTMTVDVDRAFVLRPNDEGDFVVAVTQNDGGDTSRVSLAIAQTLPTRFTVNLTNVTAGAVSALCGASFRINNDSENIDPSFTPCTLRALDGGELELLVFQRPGA